MNTKLHSFEALLVDTTGKTEITTVKSLLMALSYSEKLWEEVDFKNSTTLSIEDKRLGLSLQASKVEGATTPGAAFIIMVTSQNAEKIDGFREKLFTHALDKLGFTATSILADSLSESHSLAIFPYFKAIELQLRKYLYKNLLKKYGANWWDTTTTDQTKHKVNQRKGSEKNIVGLTDNHMLFTDFEDLSELLQRSDLSHENFLMKWNKLKGIKQKLETGSLFSSQEKTEAETLCKEVLETLSKDSSIAFEAHVQSIKRTELVEAAKSYTAKGEQEELKASKTEVVKEDRQTEAHKNNSEAVKVETSSHQAGTSKIEEARQAAGTEGGLDLISESILLQELKAAQNQENGRYVDLKAFVTKTLASKGYAFGPAYVVAKNMNEKGLVQIYDTKDEKGFTVKAIKAN